MSSVVAICQTDAIHIITDGAMYDRKGVVLGFQSKIIPLHLAKSVIAVRGASWAALPLEGILRFADSFDQVLDRLPDLMERMIAAHIEELGPDLHPADREFEVTAAGWSAKFGRLMVAVASSFKACDPDDSTGDSHQAGYQQFVPWEAPRAFTAPLIDVQGVLGRQIATVGDINELDGEVDGFALHCAQRVTPGFYYGKPVHLIGGFAELTTVMRNGFEKKVIHEWPDAIGQNISPEGAVPVELAERAMVAQAAAQEAARELQEACLSAQIVAVPPVLDIAA
jgi:hypothetical protein